MTIQIKRIYEEPAEGDGFRVLVDRLWPRAMSKERAALDRWAKSVAPSTELRKWFNHRPDRLAEFRQRYLAELEANAGEIDDLLAAHRESRRNAMTLLYAAKNPVCNHALILREAIERRLA